jgi:6-pyruvoyltetrahydropterin/6-carboxytetrahydropterin synthase
LDRLAGPVLWTGWQGRSVWTGREILMSSRGEFRVSVTKDYLVFASAHFITFAGHRCEGLHGHNYRVRVTVEGALNQEAWFVFDFVELKRIMKRLCDEIDHLVLLPLESDRIGVVEQGDTVSVSVDGKPRYVFPRRDCALLPIPNTTVEMLAQMLTERLQAELQSMGATGLTAIEMEVEENFGQSAVYRIGLKG